MELERDSQIVCDSVLNLGDNHPIDQYNYFFNYFIGIFNKYSPVPKVSHNKKFQLSNGSRTDPPPAP